MTPDEFSGAPIPSAAWLLACAIEARLAGQRLPPLTPGTLSITPLWVEAALMESGQDPYGTPDAYGPVTVTFVCNRAPGSPAHHRRVRLLATITVEEEGSS
jgi:hypothetical protein